MGLNDRVWSNGGDEDGGDFGMDEELRLKAVQNGGQQFN